MKPEDAAEIKFMAEKASSVAKLTVKGWWFKVKVVYVDACMRVDVNIKSNINSWPNSVEFNDLS